MMIRRSSLILLVFSISVFAATTKPNASTTKPNVSTTLKVPKQNASTKANSTRPIYTGTRKVITTRLGADGNPEEQCACTIFYLCDQNDVVTLPSGSGNACEANSVCCAIPLQSLTTEDGTVGQYSSSTESSSTIDIQSTFSQPSWTSAQPDISGSSCVCVPFYQCTDYDPLVHNSGSGLIDPRIPCQTPDVCCPTDRLSNVSVVPTQSSPVTNLPTVPTLDRFPPTPSPTPTFQPNPEECGIRRGIDNRIVSSDVTMRIVAPENLMQTSFGEFPWMALVLTTEIAPNGTRTENVFVCGASILSPTVVLTAAHCVNDANISLLKVRAGEYNTHRGSTEPLPHQDRAVTSIHVHPNFNSKVLFNDLALLSVSEPFELASHISPICNPATGTSYSTAESYNPNQCLATGWGKNAFAEGNFQTTLRKVDLTLVPQDQCQSQLRQTRLGQYFMLDSSFICAGGQPGLDTCQGDGGGPLICALRSNPNKYVQVGVVSWGIGCGNGVPGVYASLEFNREWLTTEFSIMNVFRRPVS